MSPVKAPDLSGLIFDANQHEPIIHPQGDFWIFAYGSLMWNPEFDYLRSEKAQLFGYHRSLCLWTVEHRGTVSQPGLVMGLDKGGSCKGRAFLVAEKGSHEILNQLNQREMITGAYISEMQNIRLSTEEKVCAICLIARRDHPQYVKNLDQKNKIKLIKRAHGQRGSNKEYVLNTLKHLNQIGIVDRSLQAIGQAL